MTIQIKAQHLSMRYKERVLFHIPQLSIGPNDAIYLKGDNGVGKTTLLKILSGLIKPTTGEVFAPDLLDKSEFNLVGGFQPLRHSTRKMLGVLPRSRSCARYQLRRSKAPQDDPKNTPKA